MILNNYWNFKAYTESNMPTTSSTTATPGILNLSGTASTLWIGYNNTNLARYTIINYTTKYNLSAVVGSGTTIPIASDYCLGNDITNSFSNIVNTFNTTATDGEIITVCTISGVNNTNDNLTIAEVGIVKTFVPTQSGGAATEDKLLFVRELLSSPITVSPNKGFSITLNWTES